MQMVALKVSVIVTHPSRRVYFGIIPCSDIFETSIYIFITVSENSE